MKQPIPTQWPASNELNHVQELEVALEREFPAAAESFGDGLSRRRWLQLMGASLALGGIVGCRDKVEHIAPFAFRPKNRIPGGLQKFATSIDVCGIGQPLLATCTDGRPIKLDGNPDHPLSQGSDTFTQATILDLYDPDRSRDVRQRSADKFVESSYQGFRDAFSTVAAKDWVVLAEPNSSPTLARLRKKLTDAGARWFEYSPINQDNQRAGTAMAMGKAYRHHYRFDQAKVIVTLDADPMGLAPDGVANTANFTKGRNPDKKPAWMSRLYSVESTYSQTGGLADHRLAIRSEMIASYLGALENEIDKAVAGKLEVDQNGTEAEKMLTAMAQDLVDHRGTGLVIAGDRQPPAVHARALRINSKLKNLGKTIYFTEPVDVDRKSYADQIEELAKNINAKQVSNLLILGGNPAYDAPVNLDGVTFSELLDTVSNSVHLSVTNNETSRRCSWHLNASHPLESWSDLIAHDGSWCIAQPLIAPLFGGKSQIELLADLVGDTGDALSLVKSTAQTDWADSDFETTWNQSVHDGFVAKSAADPLDVKIKDPIEMPSTDMRWQQQDEDGLELVFETSRSLFDGRFANNGWMQELPDFFTKLTWDNALVVSPRTAKKLKLKQGKKANVTTPVGDVTLPVMIQPGQANGTLSVEVGYGRTAAGRVGGDEDLEIESVGQNVYPLRTNENWYVANSVQVDPTSTSYLMALTQEPSTMDNVARNEINRRMGSNSALIRRDTFESYQEFKSHDHSHDGDESDEQARKRNGQSPVRNVAFRADEKTADSAAKDDHEHAHHWPTEHHDLEEFDLTPGPPLRDDVKWGMSIDLNKCTGCNSCVIACQSENNIPIVGKEQVWRGREMQWMRIDRYYPSPSNDDVDYDHAQVVMQPVTCHHCENAPCETVCPVAATTHSDEGLNDMVYNRCIGTRYCGNNCPYKVRRFNYLNYSNATTFIKYPGADAWPVGGSELALTGGSKISLADKQLLGLVFNPEVTIRSRGVMEKCTYCVQRIQNTKIEARNEKRPIGLNEIRTACQDACPAQAIEFGNLAASLTQVDKQTGKQVTELPRVRQAHDNPRAYTMLQELNNKPRTKYLARVINPHPDLVKAEHKEEGH